MAPVASSYQKDVWTAKSEEYEFLCFYKYFITIDCPTFLVHEGLQ